MRGKALEPLREGEGAVGSRWACFKNVKAFLGGGEEFSSGELIVAADSS